MPTSALMTPRHRRRKAVLYIRQSSPQQGLSHPESLRMPYARQQRAQAWGWPATAIESVDRDLGTPAASAAPRQGCKDVLAPVTLGHVGILLSFEVTRVARTCSDGSPLLDVCGARACRMADRDGVYAPGSPQGRLLLGLQGPLSELELQTIRARLPAGLLTTAQRGARALPLPVGCVREPHGRGGTAPTLEGPQRLLLVCEPFLQRRSASQVRRTCHAQRLTRPRRDRFGAGGWRFPTVAASLAIWKQPAYASAFTSGRTRPIRRGPGPPQTQPRLLPHDAWTVGVQAPYPASISGDTYAPIPALLPDHYAADARHKTRGGAPPGASLAPWPRRLWGVRP